MKPFIVYDRMGNAIIEGVEFSNGRVAVCWLGLYSSTVAWQSMADFTQISIDPLFGRQLVYIADIPKGN